MISFLELICINKKNQNDFSEYRKDNFDSNDSIAVSSNICFDTSSSKILMNFHVKNHSASNIILIPLPFFIHDNLKDEEFIWVNSHNKYSTPNILYFKKRGRNFLFASDGEYLLLYHEMPNLILLKTNDSTNLKVNIPKDIMNIENYKEFDYFGILIYAKETKAYSIAKEIDVDIMDLFQNKLNSINAIDVVPMEFDEFEKLLTEDKNKNIQEIQITKFIREAFKYKLYFRK